MTSWSYNSFSAFLFWIYCKTYLLGSFAIYAKEIRSNTDWTWFDLISEIAFLLRCPQVFLLKGLAIFPVFKSETRSLNKLEIKHFAVQIQHVAKSRVWLGGSASLDGWMIKSSAGATLESGPQLLQCTISLLFVERQLKQLTKRG